MKTKKMEQREIGEHVNPTIVPMETENKMGRMPMGHLVLAMGVPLMMSMLVQAIYNIVDSLYCSHITDVAIPNAGDKAIAALTFAFPIQMLMIAFNTGTGVGVNAILSRYLGAKNRENASKVAGNAIFLAICMYIVFLLFGIFGTNAFFTTQTSDPVIYSYGTSYIRICTTCAFGTMGFFAFEKVLQATGKTGLAMLAQLSGAMANIILDPFFIFGWCGLPAMGTAGAAVATVIGQCISLAVGLTAHIRLNKEVDNGIRYLKPNGSILKDIYMIGIPAIIMQMLVSFMNYGMNTILAGISDSMVSAFGIYNKLQSFIFMPCFGLNNALIPIVGYSYGARRFDRIRSALKYGMIDVLIIMAFGMSLMLLFSPQIVGIFAVSDEVQGLAVTAMHIICLSFLFVGANTILQGFFQALGHGFYSLAISVVRYILVLLPLAIIFTRKNITVWYTFPVSEFCALILALIMLYSMKKKSIAKSLLQIPQQ